jgi:hypothetical protein
MMTKITTITKWNLIQTEPVHNRNLPLAENFYSPRSLEDPNFKLFY